jgi:hypothetical protein
MMADRAAGSRAKNGVVPSDVASYAADSGTRGASGVGHARRCNCHGDKSGVAQMVSHDVLP